MRRIQYWDAEAKAHLDIGGGGVRQGRAYNSVTEASSREFCHMLYLTRDMTRDYRRTRLQYRVFGIHPVESTFGEFTFLVFGNIWWHFGCHHDEKGDAPSILCPGAP
jgi:hypothetical protein